MSKFIGILTIGGTILGTSRDKRQAPCREYYLLL